MNVVEIDGSYGEGGGQILRSALSLSIITGMPFRLVNIRAGREKPGLRPQHLTSVQAATTISDAEVDGAKVGSLALEFAPRAAKAGNYQFDVGTAGAVMLIFQTLLPPLCRTSEESQIFLRGGTHVPFSPPFHFVAEVFLPMVALMGVKADVHLLKAGWNPKGGGEVTATIAPAAAVQPLNLTERGTLRHVTVYALISNLPDHIAQRERDTAANLLRDLREIKPRLEIQRLPSIGEGTMVVLVAEFENTVVGFSAMGQIGKRAERVAEEAVRPFLKFLKSDATVDSHLADQLLLYMALAEGRGSIVTNELTAHVRTNVWLIEKFLPVQFKVDGELGKRATIEVG